MPIPIFKIFMVFGIVSMWATKALQDGKITLLEGAELASQLGAALGIPTELSIPDRAPEPEEILHQEEHVDIEPANPVAAKLKDMATPTPASEGDEEQ